MSELEPTSRTSRLEARLTRALDVLERARPFAKILHQGQVLELGIRLLKEPGGIEVLHEQAPRFERAGLFYGGDWDHPEHLQASFVSASLRGPALSVAVETLSELRFLAIAKGRLDHPTVSAEDARSFLENVMALNIDLLFPEASEASRAAGPLGKGVARLFQFFAEELGTEGILQSIIREVEGVLDERPIMVHRVRSMIETMARSMGTAVDADLQRRAERLIHALHGPTELSRSVPLEQYLDAVRTLDVEAFTRECTELARSMRTTGVVCPCHAVLLRYANRERPDVVPRILGLDAVGRDCLGTYSDLVFHLIDAAIHPDTAQSVYGLSWLLDRGTLFFPPVAPGLWRLSTVAPLPEVASALAEEWGTAVSPTALLLAGALSVLGQPLGLGQGQNPTCQSARAISLWAQVDSGYLLELIIRAARDGDVDFVFEGREIQSRDLEPGLTDALHTELDPISLVLVPHLDRIYGEMSRLVAGRGTDGHKWINPEFHGWWVHRGFAEAIQVGTGAVTNFEDFVRLFYATYHPFYNGGRPMAYPQPAGVAATTPHGEFLGWHAVSIQRVALDADQEMRVYFYDPNDDKAQSWGQGIVTSTSGHGEWPGESSLPFLQFTARLYVFHYNPREWEDPSKVPAECVQEIQTLAHESWAQDLQWIRTS